jgi:hypothetical protein
MRGNAMPGLFMIESDRGGHSVFQEVHDRQKCGGPGKTLRGGNRSPGSALRLWLFASEGRSWRLPQSRLGCVLEQKLPELSAEGSQADLAPGQLIEQIAEIPGGKVAVPGTEDPDRADAELVVKVQGCVAE